MSKQDQELPKNLAPITTLACSAVQRVLRNGSVGEQPGNLAKGVTPPSQPAAQKLGDKLNISFKTWEHRKCREC